MLVVISDLHFVDGTAGAHNVSCDAFLGFFDDVLTLAEEKQATSLDLLFLGDIFDLIRTEKWFEVELADRPWGRADINDDPTRLGPACRLKGLEILNAVATQVAPHLEVLTGRHPGCKERIAALEARMGRPMRRLFLPGNHDRLYAVDDAIRARTRELLAVAEGDVPELGEHLYKCARHGVVARHGHEFDVWNFEGYRPDAGGYVFDPVDYQRCPIGDPITTEIVVKLPRRVAEMLRDQVRPEVATAVYEHLQNIENVRPVTATIPWIWQQAGVIGARKLAPGTEDEWQDDEQARVTDAVLGAGVEVGREFMQLPFVKAWLDKHDRWGFDEADKLQAVAAVLEAGIGVGGLSALARINDRWDRFVHRDGDEQHVGAYGEPGLKTGEYHYVVYGHTHEFAQEALRVVDDHEKVYLNSGTWRPRYFLTRDKEAFVEWKEMTYLVFFAADEDRAGLEPGDPKGTSMLTWTGTMVKKKR
jgi:UDP-2,3-diacylglucosamine pyrophosphatase LpxH